MDESTTSKPGKQAGPSPPRVARVLRALSAANLALVIAFLIVLFVVSERWWLGTVATYSPRALVMIPSLLLILPSVFVDRWAALLNTVAALLVAIVAMEFNLPVGGKQTAGAGTQPYRVISSNIQRFEPGFEITLDEILSTERDLVVVQEALGPGTAKLTAAFPGWYIVSESEYWVASRYPAKLVGTCRNKDVERLSAVAVEIDHPDGPLVLINVHPRTARFGMRRLFPDNKLPEDWSAAIADFDAYQALRDAEYAGLQKFVDGFGPRVPLLIAGDFNAPVSSAFFKKFWSAYTDAFAATGWGYGYTAPCDGPGGLPEGMPWVRIDHLLVNDSWAVARTDIGKVNGCDHRTLSATIHRTATGSPQK